MEGDPVSAFRQRAKYEANRYGSDRWVFVRELLQNARDAAASRVWITVDRDGGRDRVTCRDDGCGMTLDHTRRFLFTLYATSKGDQSTAAGRFGIGFWSVLRFDPDTISVRSRPSGDVGWEVCLDGSLETASVAPCVMLPGTEIVLERRAIGSSIEGEVARAVHENARFLCRRDEPTQPLEITVNDRPVAAPFGLPPPSLSFRRPGLRGAVALAGEPRVEVFAHGLRVRSVAFLDELLLNNESGGRTSVELMDGLVPRVLIDSDQLQVLMARGETREDRALQRLVARARRELSRLLQRELDRRAPRARLARMIERIGGAVGNRPLRWAVTAAAVGGVIGALAGLGLRSIGPTRVPLGPPGEPPGMTGRASNAAADEARARIPYRDLAAGYRGPSVDPLDHRTAVALSYRPSTASPLFAVIRVAGFEADGAVAVNPGVGDLAPYDGTPCVDDCLDVELQIDARQGLLRLPVPTGHGVDGSTVRLDGTPVAMVVTQTGEPALRFGAPRRGTVHYVCGPVRGRRMEAMTSWPPLPPDIADRTDRMAALVVPERVAAAKDLVRSVVAYDRSAPVAARHADAAAQGVEVFERALAVGAGDCDVQNSLLAAILARTGLPSRLAVGFVGSRGQLAPGLHAWVEYLNDEQWWVADASVMLTLPTAPAEEINVEGAVSAGQSTEPAAGVDTATLMVPIGVSVAVALLGGVLVLLVMRSRTSRRLTWSDEGVDMARLLRGAVLRPQAYADVDIVYSRRVVPMVGTRAASLRQLWRLASRGRLYRSDRGSALARQASRRGVAVVDSGHAEGRVVADLLGARDLDAWDGLLDRCHGSPATRHLEERARTLGGRWHVRACLHPPSSVAVLEGEPLGFGSGFTVVMVDESSRLWKTAHAADDRPAWGALLLATGMARETGMTQVDERRLLSDLARRAIREEAP